LVCVSSFRFRQQPVQFRLQRALGVVGLRLPAVPFGIADEFSPLRAHGLPGGNASRPIAEKKFREERSARLCCLALEQRHEGAALHHGGGRLPDFQQRRRDVDAQRERIEHGPRFDQRRIPHELAKLALTEPDAQVRSQLAATARRLPGEIALPVIFGLMDRTEDVKDRHLPLMLWWALEHFSETHRVQILDEFSRGTHWDAPLAPSHILSRLAQRYVSRPSAENQQTLARLAKAAPEAARALLRQGVAAAFEGRGIGKLSPAMEAALFDADARDFSDPAQMSLAIKRGDQPALVAALGFIVREEAALEAGRVQVMQALADARAEAAEPVLLEVLSRSQSPVVRGAALAALGRYDDKQLATDLLRLWANLDPVTRQRALALLVSRRSWARDLLAKAGHSGVISKADIPDEIAQRARLLGDPEIDKLVDRFFGRPKLATSGEKQQRIDELTKLLARDAPTNLLNGQATFEARCAACHKLHGRGGDTGPDLTDYERSNLPTVLLSLVDPSIGIREGYATVQITTRDERTLIGFLAERDPTRLVLRDPAGQQTAIAASDIREERVLPMSLMPEGLLEGLSEQELRDFFAHLASAAGAPGQPK